MSYVAVITQLFNVAILKVCLCFFVPSRLNGKKRNTNQRSVKRVTLPEKQVTLKARYTPL